MLVVMPDSWQGFCLEGWTEDLVIELRVSVCALRVERNSVQPVILLPLVAMAPLYLISWAVKSCGAYVVVLAFLERCWGLSSDYKVVKFTEFTES